MRKKWLIIIGILGLGIFIGARKGNVAIWLGMFTRIYRLVCTNYVQEVNRFDLIRYAIEGMLQKLDLHSGYLDTTQYQSLKIRTRGRYGGLGFIVGKVKDALTVVDPIEGTPAYRAGIQAGDRILKIDGIPTKGMSVTEAVNRMRGKPGTPIVLTIKKEGIETPIDFHLIRENIKIKNIQYAGLIPPNIGYIRIAHFAQKAGKEVAKVIDSLKAVGAVKFIVDLRSNPGGLLTEAVEVADNFLDKSKLVVFTKGRNPSAISEYYTTTDSKIESSPLIVLVNRNSASASEIVAGAIQDWEVGLVVGDTTFGKGSVQKIVPLEMGALKLTTAMYYTPSGRCINRSDTFQFLIRNLTLGKKFYTLGRRKRELISVGSIAPDIALPPVKSLSGLLYTPKNLPPSFLIIATRKTIIRNFASKYVREHPELEEDFEVDSVMIEEFKSFLIEKEIKFKDSEFDSAVPIIVERLKEKISEAQWGTKGKYRAILSNDPWIKRSIELLSEANTLDELFKKVETKNERRN